MPTGSGSSSPSSAPATRCSPRTRASLRVSSAPGRGDRRHRLAAVRRAASRFGAVVLLKGADTLIASPREGVLVASYGRPSLATAGSGDVLTGVIAAFLAKGSTRARLPRRGRRRTGLPRAWSGPRSGSSRAIFFPASSAPSRAKAGSARRSRRRLAPVASVIFAAVDGHRCTGRPRYFVPGVTAASSTGSSWGWRGSGSASPGRACSR